MRARDEMELPIRFDSADKCPDRERFHTPHPISYLGHSTWAARMSECHTQEQCPTCGFWAVWRDVDGNVVVVDPFAAPARESKQR